MSEAVTTPLIDQKARSNTGVRTAVHILERWQASQEQQQKILRISRATLHRVKTGVDVSSLDSDQLERVSIVLNLHAALRLIFDNPANLYGFMAMPNNNPFFNGRSPLQVMSHGSMMALFETYRRIDALRGAQW